MAFRWVLLLLVSFHLLGLVIFLKGFLLARQTLSQRSILYNVWDRFPLISNNNDTPSALISLPPVVPSPPPFKRVILVVIDALRFDFMVPDSTERDKLYRNQLPIIDQLYKTQSERTLLFQFRADPPTTTMQRIKGLMTGSLPTFIDAGSNFASSSVQEDHLLYHIAARYPNLYFMGDDTWQQLFPASLTPSRTFASDSFKMFDLHTVDNRIQEQLWPLLENSTREVDDGHDDRLFVITHFLGVDHCGHTYGPDHINMATKLDEMNTVLTRLITNHVDQDTLLLVMGDHGMSVEGDHGGESVEELMSGLLLYSGRPLTKTQPKKDDNSTGNMNNFLEHMHNARSSILHYNTRKISERLNYDASAFPLVPQIYLVPTLAYLLHLPIPFGNLGALIPEVLYINEEDAKAKNDGCRLHHKWLLHMAQQFRLNALQVYDYLNTYGKETHHIGFTKTSLAPLLQHFETAERNLLEAVSMIVTTETDISDDGSFTDCLAVKESLEATILAYDSFLSHTIKYCQAIWAQFDIGCMLLGMLTLGISSITAMVLWMSYTAWSLSQLWTTVKLLVASYWIHLVVSILAVNLLWIFSVPSLSLYGVFDKIGWMDTSACAVGILTMTTVIRMTAGKGIKTTTPSKQYQQSQRQHSASSMSILERRDGLIILMAVIAQALTLGSNSFVIWEDRGSRFATVTLSVWWLLRNGQYLATRGNITDRNLWITVISKPLLVLLWTRITGLMGQCREEQFPYCSYVDIEHIKQQDDFTTLFYTFLYIFACGFALTANFLWIINTIKSRSYCWMYGTCMIAVFARMVDIAFRTITGHDFTLHILASYIGNEMAAKTRMVIELYLPRYIYGVCILGSLYVSVVKSKTTALSSSSSRQRAWFAYLCLWSTLLALLQHPLAGMVILLCPPILHLLSVNDLGSSDVDTNNYSNTRMIRLALMHTIGHQLFFVTGHQATITSLPWHAAFIGFSDMYYYIGALLVTLSTLTGYVISWIGTRVMLSDRESLNNDEQPYLIFMVLLQFIPTFLSSTFVFILRRHLMTWKIFAPRFLLQALLVAGNSLVHLLFQS